MIALCSAGDVPHLTRSTLHRCLQRHGISRLPEIAGDKPAKQPFKAYPIGCFHIDIAEVRTEEGELYLFVAVERTSKYAFARLMETATTATAKAFLDELVEAVPYKIHTEGRCVSHPPPSDIRCKLDCKVELVELAGHPPRAKASATPPQRFNRTVR